jgi:hypothetical protein
MTAWAEHQAFEREWWGSCVNTFGEETKQLTYAHRMGLVVAGGHWPVYDLAGRSVLDLGGGPVSMLLKCVNLGLALVVDPCPYPDWIIDRYAAAGLSYVRMPAEEWQPTPEPFDEAWIYNVLQHVQDPERVVAVACASAAVVRVFEWVNMEPHLGHPHKLVPGYLDEWLGAVGTREVMNENGCVGQAYYGVFPGGL